MNDKKIKKRKKNRFARIAHIADFEHYSQAKFLSCFVFWNMQNNFFSNMKFWFYSCGTQNAADSNSQISNLDTNFDS